MFPEGHHGRREEDLEMEMDSIAGSSPPGSPYHNVHHSTSLLRPINSRNHSDADSCANGEDDRQKSSVPDTQHHGHSLRRYYRRGIVGSLAPLIITLYYWLTVAWFMKSSDSPNGTQFGRSGASLVFYSWFVLAAIGLDIGEYGLIGVEASMLMETFWAVPNAWHIVMHGEHTWTGIPGWMSAAKSLTWKWREKITPSRLWWALAAPTFFFFIGLPLTGLAMELQNGFHKSNSIPEVMGQRWETFNERSDSATRAAAQHAWSLAVPPRVPGYGVLYRNSSTDRSDPKVNIPSLSVLPNIVPTDEGLDEILLAPQAETPISGKAWGLLARYNCTIIEKLEDFIILSRRNGSKPLLYEDPSTDNINSYQVGKYTIEIRNYTAAGRSLDNSEPINYEVVSELGYSRELYGDDFFASQNATNCYFNKSEGATDGYPGLEHESILEFALWQHAVDDNPLVNPPLPASFYNFSLDNVVQGLEGAYQAASEDRNPNSTVPMDAIGVQCHSSSAVGFAEVDGETSAYRNFERSDTPPTLNALACPSRLSLAVPGLIFSAETETQTWPDNFFSSAEAPPSFLTSESGDSVVFVNVRPTLLQASELRRSLLRAYGTAAVQLMYNGGQGYSYTRTGSSEQRYKFNNTNATTYKPARVLGQGPIPPLIPGIFLTLWAIGSCSLALLYGFRLRWAETLDGYSLFRFGSDQAKVNPYVGTIGIKDRGELKSLPGLVGDSKPYFDPGHVTLVDAHEAVKTKKYS